MKYIFVLLVSIQKKIVMKWIWLVLDWHKKNANIFIK